MKIKTRLILSVAIFVIALLIIIGSVIVTNQQVDRLNQQEELAKTIEIEANELSYLSSDYILYRESHQAERWESKYSALASALAALAVDTPEQRVLVDNLMENQQRLRHVFDDVKSGITGSPQGDPAIDLAVVQVSWSRLAVQTQGIVFDAGRLSHLLRDEADQVRQVGNFLILLLLGTFSLFILTSYLIVFRRTLTSIAELQDGAKVIGSGDLGYVIPEKGDDEIRDLSRAFNKMTVDLKGVTASKGELEREVAERKKAEEEVGERNEELTAINEELVAAQEQLQQANVRLERNEEDLRRKNVDLNAINEELTATQEELHHNLDELTKAVEEVRRSEERYRTLFSSMTEAFALHEIICNADGVPVDYRFLEINPAFEKQTTLLRDKVVGRLVSEVLPGIGLEWIETYGKVALTGTPVRFENYSAPLERYYDVYAFSPAPQQFATLFSDITERRRAEEALRESESVLRSFFDSSGVMRGIVEVIAEDDVLHITDNIATAAFVGLSPEAMKNKKGSELGEPHEILRMWIGHYIESQKTGKPVVFEYRDKRGDAETWLHSTVSYLGTSPDGNSRFAYVVLDISEHKRMEDNLREARMRTATILEGIADTFYSLDDQWRFVMINPAASKAPFGRPAVDLLGRVIWDLYPGLVGTRIHRHYLDAAENRSLEHYVAQSPLNMRWYEVFMQGHKGGVDVYMRDITELRQTEEKLRDTSRYLENLLDYANAPIIVWDPDFQITRFNHAFERLTGRKASEAIGQHLEALFPEKYASTAMDIIKRTTRGERLDVVEIPIHHVNGTVRTVLWNSATLFEADGKTVLSTIAQGSDITERKRAEEELLRRNEDLNAAYEEITSTQEELQQSNDELVRSEQELRKTSQYLENLIDYANAPIVVWDPHFVITRFNHAFEELTGRTAREIIGQRLEVLFPQRYLDASMAIIRKTMEGERLKVVEIPILNRRGEIRIVLWNSATLFEADGTTVQSTIAQGNDITERKVTEAELEERNEELNSAIEELTRRGHELNEALNEKEVLLSEVHHRVKNNLTAFISLLSLESSYDDTPVGLALKKDLQNRARSMALIHETLYRTKKYSRVNMDVYLSTLVGQVVSSYESGKSIQTIVDTHGITLDLSRATPGGLIINELLTNSLKYAFPPSFDCQKIRGAPCMIAVTLIEDDGAYILTVGDNGVGLPKDFDIAGTKTLGLKLVNFLARHQLRASVEVHSDNGVEFRFRFQDKV